MLDVFTAMVLGTAQTAAPPLETPQLYFGALVGWGAAQVEHEDPRVPQTGYHPGLVLDAQFGWQVTRTLAAGVELGSWQINFAGTPYHLHTFGPRMEYSPQGGPVYLAGTVAVGMTDGDVRKRAGGAANAGVGWRAPIVWGVEAGIETGWLVHVYDGKLATAFEIGTALRIAAPIPGAAAPRGPPIVVVTQSGAGSAAIEHEQIPGGQLGGGTWAFLFGIGLGRRLTTGIEFTSWQVRVIGTPHHLHTISPYLEAALDPRRGPFVVTSIGAGTTDGDVRKRSGTAAGTLGGWRYAVHRRVSIGALAGMRWHRYNDGSEARELLAEVQLRFSAGSHD